MSSIDPQQTTSSESELDAHFSLQDERSFLANLIDCSDDDDFQQENGGGDDDTANLDEIFANIPAALDEHCDISVLGTVVSKVSPFVILNPSSSIVVDLGTMVVSDASREICGVVWDVFGPIDHPKYCILPRNGQIHSFSTNQVLRYNPSNTTLVSKEALCEIRGIDQDDNGPVEFSDDEEERAYKRGLEPGEI